MSETERTLLIADLSGYTALTETHGAMHASDVALRFGRMAEASLEHGVTIIDRVGDQVLVAGGDTLAVLRCALRLCAAVEREPGFLAVQAGLHRGPVVEREGRLFGAPLNLTSRIASHARGGQILCTGEVVSAARGFPDLESRPKGEKRFKNVARPVAIFELRRMAVPANVSPIDPVCRMRVTAGGAAATFPYLGTTYHFCSRACAEKFAATPENYMRLWG